MKARAFILIVFVCLLLGQFSQFYQSPSNDAFAYYNIASNIIKHGKAVTDEIFPNTVLHIRDYPAPIIRRSIVFSYLAVPFVFLHDSPRSLSVMTMVISVLNLGLLMLVAGKLFSQKAAILAGLFYVVDPFTYSMAYTGISEPVFCTLMIIAFYFLHIHLETEKYSYFNIFAGLLAVSLYIRPHAILYLSGAVLYLLRKRAFKQGIQFLLIILVIATPLSVYKHQKGVTGSLSKYFLLDSVGRKYNNHVFERVIVPDDPVKVILQNKILFVRKVARKMIAQFRFVIEYPFSASLVLMFLYSWWRKPCIHGKEIYFMMILFLLIFFVFSLFFVEQIRYYWPLTVLLMCLNAKWLEREGGRKQVMIFLVLSLIFIWSVRINYQHMDSRQKGEYFQARENVMKEFNPYISKGVMTDIPWCGAAFLKKPCIWIPARIEDVRKVKQMTGIDLILVTGLWIEPGKLVEDFDLSRLPVVFRTSRSYAGKELVSVLYRIE